MNLCLFDSILNLYVDLSYKKENLQLCVIYLNYLALSVLIFPESLSIFTLLINYISRYKNVLTITVIYMEQMTKKGNAC